MLRPDFRWIKRLKQMTLADVAADGADLSVLHHYPRVAASAESKMLLSAVP